MIEHGKSTDPDQIPAQLHVLYVRDAHTSASAVDYRRVQMPAHAAAIGVAAYAFGAVARFNVPDRDG